MTTAHIAGLPIEETLAMSVPALLTALGAAVAQLRARRRPEIGIARRKMGPSARCSPAGARVRSLQNPNSRSQEES